MGRTDADDDGAPAPARHRLPVTIATLTLLASAGGLAGCSSSDDNAPAPKAHSGAPEAVTTLSKSAPTYCKPLISTQVRRLTRALPSIPVAGGQSATADTVASGAATLKRAAADMPAGLATASRRVAATATAYLDQPRSRDRLDDAVHALQDLARQSHQECGL